MTKESKPNQITVKCICGKKFKVEDEVDFRGSFEVGYHTCPYCSYSGYLRSPLTVFDD